MENNIYKMAANHIKLIENCFSKLCELISAIKNGEDGARLQEICNEISLRETEADFCLQSVTTYAQASPVDDKISEFSVACDSIANRCEDFANGIRRTNKDMVAMFSADILEMLQKISLLFDLLQQMLICKDNSTLAEKIDSAETELDKYEENILKKIMSAPFLQSDKMQFMLYINKISKIPDVIKGNVKKVCKKT